MHARRDGTELDGFVYLGAECVYHFKSTIDRFPAGIDDFAGITYRRFARRLWLLVQPDGQPDVDGAPPNARADAAAEVVAAWLDLSANNQGRGYDDRLDRALVRLAGDRWPNSWTSWS